METIGVWNAFWLGILESLTEFIPVSSTGHLILLGRYLQLQGAKVDTFLIFIQLGAILSVVVLYWDRFKALLRLDGAAAAQPAFYGWNGWLRLGLACLPIFIIGKLFHRQIKELLFSPLPIAIALIVGGAAMVVLDSSGKEKRLDKLEDLSPGVCFGIGLFQCLALWPGVSRSASTIIGAMLLGSSRIVAAEFSFLLAVPVICVAVTFDLYENLTVLAWSDWPSFTVGFLMSFMGGLAAIKFFLRILAHFSLRPFGYYRILLGLLVIFFAS